MFKENRPEDRKIPAVIDEHLLSKLDHLQTERKLRVLIKLREEPVRSVNVIRGHDWRTLEQMAAISQRPIVEYLTQIDRNEIDHTKDGEREENAHSRTDTKLGNEPDTNANGEVAEKRVSKFKSFWLVNLLFAELDATQIHDLAKMPDVLKIYEDLVITAHPESVGVKGGWDNIGFTGAPEVWAQGYRGQNVKLAVLDTGVDINHPELLGALGGTPPYYEGYWVEFDEDGNPVEGSTPHDSDSHGTHVSGTALGRNRNVQIGMAPEAILGHALVLPGGSGTLPQVIAGLQWAYQNGFQVVNSSLGSEGISTDLEEAVERLVAAGAFPAFSIGNEGENHSSSPGNTPLATGVGAFDSQGVVADFSSGGIVQYPDFTYLTEDEKIKPDISAPGVEILSAIPGGKYAVYSGTSMASPHVAGAVALLLSKNPDMTVAEIKEILYKNVGKQVGLANDPGENGKDVRYGWGRLNVAAAMAKVPEPGPFGSVQGYVLGENEFVAGASINFTGPLVKKLTADEHGFFMGTLPPGTYQATARANAYQSKTVEVTVEEGQNIIVNFALELAPLGTITGVVVDAENFLPLTGVSVEVPGTALKTVTDADGYYGLNLKEGTYSLLFTKTGYNPLLVEDVQVLPGQVREVNAELVYGYENVIGQVLDQQGHPISFAFLEITETDDTAFTDEAGNFVLSVPAGTYHLQVNKVGYQGAIDRLIVDYGEIFQGTLEMCTQPVEIYFESHFDSPEEWSVWEGTGGWHKGARRYITPDGAAYNGHESSGKYPNSQHAILKTHQPISIPADATNAIVHLNFHLWGRIEKDYDVLVVAVESENSTKEIYQFSAMRGKWQNIMLDLTEYAGKSVSLIFDFTSDSSVVFEGVYIDDVFVYRER